MKAHHVLLLSLRWVLAAAVPVEAPSEDGHEVVPGAYVVEFDTPQLDDDFLRNLGSADLSPESHSAISSSVFHGASFRLRNNASSDHDATAARIAGLPHVKQLWPVRIHQPPRDDVVWVADGRGNSGEGLGRIKRDVPGRNDTFSPHVMTQVDRLRAEGYTGKGFKVAVLDTGVDYTHPALGGCFGPGCVVSFGADLVGDAYNGSNTPVPDDDPWESCPGSDHGTHVTGIIAAKENPFGFTGAAPGVELGVYKVFGCSGGVADDVLMAAFLRAFDDGSHIITASIGSSSGWSDTPTAAALNRIVEAGVVVTIAAGNEGQRGMFYAGSGAAADKVTAVAMVDNDKGVYQAERASFTVNNATTDDFGWVIGTPDYAANVTLPLYVTGNTTDANDDACRPLPDQTPDLGGFIVLVREPDGTSCTVEQQARNIFNRGGRYLLMYSTTANMANAWVYELPEFRGAAAVNRRQAAAWINLLAEGNEIIIDMTASALAETTYLEDDNAKTGGYVSFKSTWGPTWELNLKPTLGTVGSNILSTFPVRAGGYGVLSGTSMAAPLGAAIYALPEFRGAAAVNRRQAAAWINLLAEGNEIIIDMTASALAETTYLEDDNAKTGGYVSFKSTWGPTWELNLKPTLGTVGSNILSTFPVRAGGYGVLSGTSMAAPLGAAIYALVAQARGTHDPSVLQRALMSTAQPNRWLEQPSAGLASVAQQGAGLAKAYDAAHVQTLLSVASIALNDSDHHRGSHRFAIQNTGPVDMVYDLGHVPAASMNTFKPGQEQAVDYPNPVAEGHAAVSFNTPRLTVAAGESVEVQVDIAQPATLDPALLPVYSGYITVNGTSQGSTATESLSIPYMGVVGSMHSTPMFDSSFFSMFNFTQYPEPIAQADPAFYLPYPVDFSTPVGRGIGWPYVQLRLHMGTRALHVELMRVSSDSGAAESLGSIRTFPWFFATREPAFFQFNGMLGDGTVAPAGRCFVRVRAQRIFGDPATEEGWEMRDFPVFDLVYTTSPSTSAEGHD
ncbi:hypothetical protein PG999_014747 [Apiospora kogelbergensis]|uniref:Minor extracellular protease vpr n=1 Tax=Apiospora kogelbergensis TaxID=1337665 RepID=A0AAW0Q2S4_9PEZI